jgi:Tfp pilus assembly protein PilO
MPIKKIIHKLELRFRALQKTQDKKQTLNLLLVIIAIVLGFFLFVQPLIGRIDSVNSQITNAKVQYAKFTRLFASRADYTARFQEYQDYVIQKRTDEEEVAQMLKQVEAITQEFSGRLRITDIKPRQVRKEGFVKILSVQIQMEADSFSLANFIYKVGTVKELLRVDQYVLSPKERDNGVIDASVVVSKILIES